jgi:hypothetical protein
VARIELSSNGKMVYLRIEESATEVWLKVELHRVISISSIMSYSGSSP